MQLEQQVKSKSFWKIIQKVMAAGRVMQMSYIQIQSYSLKWADFSVCVRISGSLLFKGCGALQT